MPATSSGKASSRSTNSRNEANKKGDSTLCVLSPFISMQLYVRPYCLCHPHNRRQDFRRFTRHSGLPDCASSQFSPNTHLSPVNALSRLLMHLVHAVCTSPRARHNTQRANRNTAKACVPTPLTSAPEPHLFPSCCKGSWCVRHPEYRKSEPPQLP